MISLYPTFFCVCSVSMRGILKHGNRAIRTFKSIRSHQRVEPCSNVQKALTSPPHGMNISLVTPGQKNTEQEQKEIRMMLTPQYCTLYFTKLVHEIRIKKISTKAAPFIAISSPTDKRRVEDRFGTQNHGVCSAHQKQEAGESCVIKMPVFWQSSTC